MLPFIAQHVPVIWRLPDMWPFTGHCAYSYDCKRWEIGCGKCPRLSDYPELLIDTTRFLWKRKKRLYNKIRNRLVLVSWSQWLRQQIERSPIMKNLRCVVIPAAVDMEIFRPGLREESRKSLGIASSERVIMVSAVNMKEARKGGADIVSMLVLLVRRYRGPITVLAVGYHSEKFLIPKGIRMVSTGFVNDDYMLSACYNAADVYVSLSHADNLPNTLIEAAACGIPIVCRNVGGCTEAIVPGVSGYAVADPQEAAVAVERLLRDTSYNSIFSAAAREHAQKYFSMDSQVLAYAALANDIAERIR
jgi:glycosyltransferase involved in cell wall biosynthesis